MHTTTGTTVLQKHMSIAMNSNLKTEGVISLSSVYFSNTRKSKVITDTDNILTSTTPSVILMSIQ